jgi:formamidopyrimidine-DNA glycosylase
VRPSLLGRTVRGVSTSGLKLRRDRPAGWADALVGRRFTSLSRRGKWIVAGLDAGALLIHLGMTGQLRVVDPAEAVAPHTHCRFALDDGRELRFRDERRFGSVDHFADPDALTRFLDARLGPEPFDLDPIAWRSALKRTRRCIKAALLDQAVVAGVGNIYADESLFVARVPPTARACRLTAAQAERLRVAIAEVLRRAVETNGSSIRNYLDGAGERGSYQHEFRVYGRTGEPCRDCGGPIRRRVIAGRSTHDCPRCQGSGRTGPAGMPSAAAGHGPLE